MDKINKLEYLVAETEGVESSSTDAPEGSSPQSEETGSQPDKLQKRFDTLTRQRYEEKARADTLERELAELKARMETKAPESPDLAPNPDNFESPGDFQKAMTDYTRRVAEDVHLAANREREQAEAKRRREELSRSYVEKVSASVDSETLERIANSRVNLPESALETLWGMEKAAEMTVFLADNPEEAVRISRLDPMTAAKEMGRIEATLESLSGKQVSDAPSNMQEPENDASGSDDVEPQDADDTETWLRKRREHLKRIGKR